jgi:hypothetical protein
MSPGSPCTPACWSLILFAVFFISHIAIAQTDSPTSINFGNVQVGSTLIKPVAITNTGKSNLTISQASASGTGFRFAGPNLPIVLSPQQSTNLSVSFAPQAAGTFTGAFTVSSFSYWGHTKTHSYSSVVSLSGAGYNVATPGYLNAPSSMSLGGSILVGTSTTKALTLSNSGGSSLTISAATVSGTGFSVSGLTFPYTLAAGSSANLSVTFAATAAGTDNATLTISSNASDSSVAISLSGTATTSTATLGVTPGSMSFGTLTIGSSQSQKGSITASGASVTVSSASSSNSEFALSGLTLPVTIAAGQSVSFTVTFTPTVAGTASGNISFLSSGATMASETASGAGATVQHTVDLSWNASTSTSVSGYNVYRSTTTGGPYTKINPSLNSSMNYSDSTVQSGKTYYYVTTAVSSTGAESSYSSQVTAVVPSP